MKVIGSIPSPCILHVFSVLEQDTERQNSFRSCILTVWMCVIGYFSPACCSLSSHMTASVNGCMRTCNIVACSGVSDIWKSTLDFKDTCLLPNMCFKDKVKLHTTAQALLSATCGITGFSLQWWQLSCSLTLTHLPGLHFSWFTCSISDWNLSFRLMSLLPLMSYLFTKDSY